MSGKSAKKPLERRVRVYLDDEPIEALEAARRDLAEAEARADETYQRRVSLLRNQQFSPDALLDAETRLATERDDTLAPLRKAVSDAEKAVRDASQVYLFRSIGRHRYQALVDEHPAEDDDHEGSRSQTGNPDAKAAWHADTFVPALLAASCVDPGLSLGEAVEVYRSWTDSEVTELFTAALVVNTGRRVVELGPLAG